MKTASNIVKLAKSWLGKKESDGTHKSIIDIYNSHKPLARGYKVKYTDAWCATFISALSIKLGYTDIIPTECGCEEMIKLFTQKGVFVENENRIAKVGDIVFYDWQDNGAGDNKGYSDHVGIVTNVSRETFTVIEGNYDNAVKERVLQHNTKYIRGFAVPKYDEEIKVDSVNTYKVQKGDTLSAIANKYGITVTEIQKANSALIKNINSLEIGWILNIPAKPTTNYEAIGRAFEKCWNEIEKLDSYKKLMELL